MILHGRLAGRRERVILLKGRHERLLALLDVVFPVASLAAVPAPEDLGRRTGRGRPRVVGELGPRGGEPAGVAAVGCAAGGVRRAARDKEMAGRDARSNLVVRGPTEAG